MRALTVFLAVLFLGMNVVPAVAGPSDGGLIFTQEERDIIREVLHATKAVMNPDSQKDDHHDGKKHKGGKDKGSLPPGLAKRDGDLPPGLEKHLEKHGTLPPGLEKRDLPDDLKHRLGKPHKGTGRYIVNDDIVLIEEATGVILDVIENVFGD